jgi:hypothetical protein
VGRPRSRDLNSTSPVWPSSTFLSNQPCPVQLPERSAATSAVTSRLILPLWLFLIVRVADAEFAQGCWLGFVAPMLHAVAPEQFAVRFVDTAVNRTVPRRAVLRARLLETMQRDRTTGGSPPDRPAIDVEYSVADTSVPPSAAARIAAVSGNRIARFLQRACRRSAVSPPWF